MFSKYLLLFLNGIALLSLSGCCDRWKSTQSSTEKEAAALAQADSVLLPEISSEEHFTTLIREAGNVVAVKIDAPWCAACKYLHPLLVQTAKQMPEITFARLNIDQLSNIAKQYNVVGIPTILFFKQGKEISHSRIEGAEAKNVDELVAQIKKSVALAQTAVAETVAQVETAPTESSSVGQ